MFWWHTFDEERERVAFISISWENRRRIKAKELEIYQISKLRTENMASVGIIAASRRPNRGRTKWKKCQTLGNGSNGSMISMHEKLDSFRRCHHFHSPLLQTTPVTIQQLSFSMQTHSWQTTRSAQTTKFWNELFYQEQILIPIFASDFCTHTFNLKTKMYCWVEKIKHGLCAAIKIKNWLCSSGC